MTVTVNLIGAFLFGFFFHCCFAFEVFTGMLSARSFAYFYLQKI